MSSMNIGLMSLLAHRTAHGDAHRTAAPAGGSSLEEYGFNGFPGNPLLASALIETRAAVLLEHRPHPLGGALDVGGALTALPAVEQPANIHVCGPGPRAALADFELLSSVSFVPPTAGNEVAAMNGPGGVPIAAIRRPSLDLFRAQLEMIDAEAASRDRRYPEVLTQVAPPIAFYASVVNLRADRHRRTMELVNAAIVFANTTVMRFKHAFACPRPSEFSAAIQPVIEVPPHASFPAGHACEGHVIARVLAALIPNAAGNAVEDMLRSVALRIAHNRIVAGLHFHVDNVAGRLLGDALAGYFIGRCLGTDWTPATFAPGGAGTAALAVAGDADDPYAGYGCTRGLDDGADAPNPILGQMWADASAEW